MEMLIPFVTIICYEFTKTLETIQCGFGVYIDLSERKMT